MTVEGHDIAYGHRHEGALARAAADLADGELASAWLDLATGAPAVEDLPPADGQGPTVRRGAAPLDPRIETAITALQGLGSGEDTSAGHLSALVGLSPSRFLHLFRDHTGTSFRRYRLWLRMLRVAQRVRDGANLTTAAVDAGFASPSHFSDSFYAMFGLRPSHLVDSETHLP